MDVSKTLASMIAKKSRPMLKNRAIALDLNKAKKNKQQKAINTHVNSADVQIFNSDMSSYCPSVIVSSEGKSYLFNCPDSFQRVCISDKIKTSVIEDVFITNHKWSRVLGLYGHALTQQDVGCIAIKVRANERAKNMFKSAEPFVRFYTGMTVDILDRSAGDFVGPGLMVSSILIHSAGGQASADDQKAKRMKSLYDLEAFVCKLPDMPGHLDAEKCRQLGVPIGPLLRDLKAGLDVTLPNGKLVKSKDVCGPAQNGLKFIILECPSEDMIDHFINNATLNDLKSIEKSDSGNHISFVIHMCPKDVTNDSRYRDWINGFHKDCKHLLANGYEFDDIGLLPIYRLNYALNTLDKEIFPSLPIPDVIRQRAEEEFMLPYEDRRGKMDSQHEITCEDPEVDFFTNREENIIQVAHGDKFSIRPHRSFTFNDNTLGMDRFIAAAHSDMFVKTLKELRQKQSELPKPHDYEPEVVFLGTASATPTKYRNVTGILVNLYHPKKLSFIMDCGEGTLYQMIRLYGQKRTDEILKQLRLITVSHIHPDHQLGLLSILERRAKLTQEPVVLIMPPGIEVFIRSFNQNFTDLTGTYEFFNSNTLKIFDKNGHFYYSDKNRVSKEILMEKIKDFASDLVILPVEHCSSATALVVDLKIGHPELNAFRLAFSGDCRPSNNFAHLAKNCDLLIHEATFDHRQEEDAIVKKHCTSHEAIEVSRKMSAKFTILTHFSARMSNIVNFTEMFDDRIGFAYDFMSLRCPSQLPRIPLLKDALCDLFADELNRVEDWQAKARQKAEFRKTFLAKTSPKISSQD